MCFGDHKYFRIQNIKTRTSHLNTISSRKFFLPDNPHCCTPFLGAFAKLRRATISFVISVCLSVLPSVRMEQLGSHWTDFHGIFYVSTFRTYIENIKVSKKSDKKNGYFT
jgi:hypothetical protein